MHSFRFGRRVSPWRAGLRAGLPIAAMVACLGLLSDQLAGLDGTAVAQGLASVTAGQWTMSILLTALSFLAISQYDVLFHGWLDTGIPPKLARRSGAAAIALSQTLGFGLFTGTVGRWRALKNLSVLDALKVTNYVSLSFMAALGLFSLPAFWMLHGALPWALLPFGGMALLAIALLSMTQPLAFPSFALLARLAVLAAVDICFAALALWVLLPAAPGLDLSLFLPAFILALGLALLSGAPGGVGPFELYLVSALPSVPQPELVASILAFRLVYYALPACIGLVCLARPMRGTEAARAYRGPIRRAEALLARTGPHSLLETERGGLLVAPGAQALVAIDDPVDGGVVTGQDLAALNRTARARVLWPALYKCSGRSAVAARRSGWSVLAIAREAWVTPATFTTECASRRQLRRKLRRAEKAGVAITEPVSLPITEMSEVAAEWAARAGGERGFSMGRFSPDHVTAQRCFLAHLNGHLVAFATFHAVDGDWCLDLMRSRDDMPDGTMHALIVRAIEAAAAERVARLSLAAMPLAEPSGPLSFLAKRRDARGLVQFKTSFAPSVTPLYLAAPGPLRLWLTGLDILARIRFPPRLTLSKNATRTGIYVENEACNSRNAALQQSLLSYANDGTMLLVSDGYRQNRRYGHDLHDRT